MRFESLPPEDRRAREQMYLEDALAGLLRFAAHNAFVVNVASAVSPADHGITTQSSVADARLISFDTIVSCR